MEWRSAKVIDNVDELKKGRIKVQILPEFSGVDTTNCPWIYPYLQENDSHYIPEINEFVKVIIRDKYWKQIEYIVGDYVRGKYPYTDFENMVSSITELNTQTYPQPKFIKKFKDGTFLFYNSETGECGIKNKNGTYILIDKDGNIIQNTNTSKFVFKNSTKSLKTDLLKVILETLQYIMTGGLTTGAGPAIPADASKIQPVIDANNITLDNLFEE